MNAPKPPEYPTHKLEKPDKMEILLAEIRAEMRDRFHSLEDLVLSFGQRVVTLEASTKRHSEAARVPSQHDLDAQAALAQEIAAREALAKKVDETHALLAENTAATTEIKKAVVGFFTNKKVIFVGRCVFAIAMGYAGLKGIKVLP